MEKPEILKKIYVICPVQYLTETENQQIREYIAGLERSGYSVHYPPRDTVQSDETAGLRICHDNCLAIREASEIHIYWTQKSRGSVFDLGMAFKDILDGGKKMVLINRADVEKIVQESTAKKSLEHILLSLDTGLAE